MSTMFIYSAILTRTNKKVGCPNMKEIKAVFHLQSALMCSSSSLHEGTDCPQLRFEDNGQQFLLPNSCCEITYLRFFQMSGRYVQKLCKY